MTPGDLIGDRYTLVRLIGAGAMGSVWEATDGRLDARVAIKFLDISSADFRERFRREAVALAQMHDPNVVNAIDFDADHDPPYLVMRFVDGTPLEALPTPQEPAVVRRIVHGIASGLAAAHDVGAVHRDLKPSNVLVTQGGEAVIIDFGLVTRAEGSTLTAAWMGTPEYWAPEQALGQTMTGKADVYALGVIAFQLLTETLPFPVEPGADRIAASTIRTQHPAPSLVARGTLGTDGGLSALVDDMLATNPDHRPSARAVATRSEPLPTDDLPLPAAAPPTDTEGTAADEPSKSRSNRTPLIAIGIAVAVAIVILVIAGITLTGGNSGSTASVPATSMSESAATDAADTTTATTADDSPAQSKGIVGRFGSFDTIQQCRGLGDAVECYSSKSGMVVRLSVEGGVGQVRTVDSRPWTGTTRALAMGAGTPNDPDSPIYCLSSRRGITCGFDPGIPYLGKGTDDAHTGTLTGCGLTATSDYFVIGDTYVRYCKDGVEKRIEG